MSTTTSPAISPSISADAAHLSPALVTRISQAYSDSDSTIARRVVAIRSALASGVTVKGITADMAAAAAVDPSITAVTATIYGYAAAASWAFDLSRTPSLKDVSGDTLATLARAAKHVGVGAFKAAVRHELADFDDDATSADRLAAILDAATALLRTVRADRAPKTREAHSQGGTRDEAGADSADAVIAPAAVSSPDADVLAAIRRATKFLQSGGAYTDDLGSALAELTDAASKARKRTRVTA